MIGLALVSVVSAFAFGSPYYDGYEFEMAAGEVRTLNFNLQNKGGATEDVTAGIWLVDGDDVASLKKEEYLVKAGERIDVPVTIKIPSDAEDGDKYLITISTKTITPGDSGGVAMGIGMTSSLNVVVSGKVEKSNTGMIVTLIIAIIVLLAIIIKFVLKRKKKIK